MLDQASQIEEIGSVIDSDIYTLMSELPSLGLRQNIL